MREYFYYYRVYQKNGTGYLVRALDELQAIAKVKHLCHVTDTYLCVTLQP